MNVNNNNSWRIGKADTDDYCRVIRSFFADDEKYYNFRRHPLYQSIIGSPHPMQAMAMYRTSISNGKIKPHLDTIIKKDMEGNPHILHMNDGVRISANVGRYLNTICEIETHFGSLDEKKIIEVGVGFGFLKYIIELLYNDTRYMGIDFTESLMLAEKFSGKLCNEVTPIQCDLLIAEYSLSENSIKTMLDYVDSHIQHANNVFLRTMLLPTEREILIDRIERTHTVHVKKELLSLFSEGNDILICKKKVKL